MLQGVHVVTLAVNIPGPVAAARLRDLGATVTKIEPPSGDPLQRIGPEWYAMLTQNMQVRTLNLKREDDRQELDGLLSGADLLLTASRPAALERLGLGWLALHDRFPRLCHVAITGFAPPLDNEAGHDLTYQAALGTLMPPHVPRILLADMAGAERAVSAVLGLLLHRERRGEAGCAAVSLAQAAADFAATLQHGITAPGGILGGGLPNYRVYPTAEGWLAVAALEPHFLERLRVELALESVTEDTLSGVLLCRTAAEWENWARARDLPLAVVHEWNSGQY